LAKPTKRQETTSLKIPRKLEGKTDGQNRLIEAMMDSDITICDGPPGSGKTFIAVGTAMKEFRDGNVKSIIVCRPAVTAGEEQGFLPGDISEKYSPFVEPIYDAIRYFCTSESEYETITNPKSGIVKLSPLAFMRGLNFRDSFAILDEAQNATYDQIKMFVSRLCYGSKAAIMGSLTQCDLPTSRGFRDAIDRITSREYRKGKVSFVGLTRKDIVRSGLVGEILEAMEDDEFYAEA